MEIPILLLKDALTQQKRQRESANNIDVKNEKQKALVEKAKYNLDNAIKDINKAILILQRGKP